MTREDVDTMSTLLFDYVDRQLRLGASYGCWTYQTGEELK